jgi:hypothetical protein
MVMGLLSAMALSAVFLVQRFAHHVLGNNLRSAMALLVTALVLAAYFMAFVLPSTVVLLCHTLLLGSAISGSPCGICRGNPAGILRFTDIRDDKSFVVNGFLWDHYLLQVCRGK